MDIQRLRIARIEVRSSKRPVNKITDTILFNVGLRLRYYNNIGTIVYGKWISSESTQLPAVFTPKQGIKALFSIYVRRTKPYA